MIVGLPKEIKDNEYRVGLTPAGVRALKDAGHDVRVETNAGGGSGFEDSLYERAGATIVDSADEVWASADMIVKVKEPIAPEYPRMREGLDSWCRECHVAATREWRERNRDYVDARNSARRAEYAAERGPLERRCANPECGRAFVPARRDARTCSSRSVTYTGARKTSGSTRACRPASPPSTGCTISKVRSPLSRWG